MPIRHEKFKCICGNEVFDELDVVYHGYMGEPIKTKYKCIRCQKIWYLLMRE